MKEFIMAVFPLWVVMCILFSITFYTNQDSRKYWCSWKSPDSFLHLIGQVTSTPTRIVACGLSWRWNNK
jgi:Fe2+ transport system protein B